MKFKNILFLVLIGILYLTISLYDIDRIPGEWFGDISNVHEYEQQVLRGEWPFYFFQSPGPLYHYLIAPVVILYQNHGYETYKLASVMIGFLGLVTTYLLAKEMGGKKLAYLTALTMSISLWYMIWSRLGNSQIVIPALVSLISYFFVRYTKKEKVKDLLMGGVVSSLGWYTYPQTFILPILFLSMVIVHMIFTAFFTSGEFLDTGHLAGRVFKSYYKPRILNILYTIIIMTLLTVPFINIVRSQPDNFGQGYVGQKILPVFSMPVDKFVRKAALNYSKTLLMLHVRGDATFRVNVSGHPQIDNISGIFFLLGFIYFIKRKRKVWLFFIIYMLLVLPLPSISPAIPDAEIPNSGRTIALIPFVFLLVSLGLLWSFEFTRDTFKKKLIATSLISLVFAYVVSTNLKLYFVNYADGLPDRNLAPGKIIAKFVDSLPSNIALYFSSCCWGEWGEPEPKGIVYVMRKKRYVYIEKLVDSCSDIKKLPALIIGSPKKDNKLDKFRQCFSKPEDSKPLLQAQEVITRTLLLK